jgi:GT2 family glycosyltransferase
MQAHVTVIVLNWNNWEDTLECLESLFRSDYPSFTVVVCDNASEDGSAEHIREWAAGRRQAPAASAGPFAGRGVGVPRNDGPIVMVEHDRASAESGGGKADREARLVLVHTGANLGFAGGNNVGLRYFMARGDSQFVWLLNNDTVVDPGALRDLVRAVSGDVHDRPAGSDVYDYSHPDRLQLRAGQKLGIPGLLVAPRYTTRLDEVDYLMGASIFLSRRRLAELGLMNEEYFLNAEDLEYTYLSGRRFRRQHPGLTPFLVAGRIWHKESATQGRNRSMHSYYFTRNVLYASAKIGTVTGVTTLCYAVLRALFALSRLHLGQARGTLAGIRDYLAGVKGRHPGN